LYKDFGILITAYENVEQTLQNIKHIRKNFSRINKCQIVVISTTEKPQIRQQFTNLLYHEGLQPLIVKVLDNVPGNPGVEWERPEWETAINWRHRYLGGRIFKSLSVGWNILYDLGIKTCLHLHSDSFINQGYENNLLIEIENIGNAYLGYWDICNEDTGGLNHIHPEGILIDLASCKNYGILDIFECFKHPAFQVWNWGSIEALIGCWFNFKIDDKAKNIGIDDVCCKRYYEVFQVRCQRMYHGVFDHIVNLGGVQPDAVN